MLLTMALLTIVVLTGAIIIFKLTRSSQVSTEHARNKPNRYVRSHQRIHEEPMLDLNSLKNPDSVLGLEEKKAVPAVVESEPKTAEPEVTEQSAPAAPARIIALNIMAEEDNPYNGYELLQAILAAGLRYGKMNIFHRFEQKTGRGRILFSLASINKPGTFDLPKMGGFSCPGLTLFMMLKDLEDPLVAFEVMLETAEQLVDGLGGVVLDDQKQALTKDYVVRIRQDIREHVEQQRVPDMFET